eukprot:GILI01024628.1.p1 GENE.GILI01024628.1~~GILI01024628.1.p1  ORF type:complete len:379 (-),score=32.18 GILI01024628.1:29-1114(-)
MVGERKKVELQILKLRQALSALQTDAHLNGILEPTKEVTEDTQRSTAAVEVMIDALLEKRDHLSAQIVKGRHKKHSMATEIQIEKERATLAESEHSLLKHIRNSEITKQMALQTVAAKNQSHQQKVQEIFVSSRLRENAILRELNTSIQQQDSRLKETSMKKMEEKSRRYDDYCKKEKEMSDRRQEMEVSRPIRDRKSVKKVAEATPVTKHPPLSRPNPHVSVVLQPIRGLDFQKKLDEADQAHLLRSRLEREARIARVVDKRHKFGNLTSANKDTLHVKAMQAIHNYDVKRIETEQRISDLRRDQEIHTSLSQEERVARGVEAQRRANQIKGDGRWSRRAQRLIESVCSDVMPNSQEEPM